MKARLRSSPLWAAGMRLMAEAELALQPAVTRRLRAGLAFAFPELSAAGLDRLVRRSVRSVYARELETQRMEAMTSSELRAFLSTNVEVAGAELFRALCDSPAPVLVFSPHWGAYAVASLRLALDAEGRKPAFCFYNPPERNPFSPRMTALLGTLAAGAQPVLNDRAGVMKAARGLRRGGLVGIMPDYLEPGPSTVFVPFLGKFHMAMPGTAFLALRARATVVPCYCQQVGAGRFRLTYEAPIDFEPSGHLEDDIPALLARIFANMERWILRSPEEWSYWGALPSRIAKDLAPSNSPERYCEQLEYFRRDAAFEPLQPLLRELEARLDGKVEQP